MHIRFVSAVIAAGAFAAGCNLAPSAKEVGDAASEAVVTVATQAGKASSSTANMSGLDALGDGLSAVGERQKQLLEPLRPGFDAVVNKVFPRSLAETPLRAPASTATLQLSTEEEMERSAEALGRFLRERIFTEDNEESRNLGEVIFRITGEDVCVYEDAAGNWVPSGETCVTEFDRYEVRVKATHPDYGLELTLLLGPDRDGPFSLILSRQMIAWTTDLAELKDAYLYIAEVNEVTIEVPDVMVGRVRVVATRLGEDHYSLALAVLDEVKVEQDVGSAKLFFHTAAKSPVSSVEFDAKQKRLSYDLDLGVTKLGIPYSYTDSTSTTEKQLLFNLGGASASFDTREGDTELVVYNIGAGDEQTYYALDADKLLTVDVNADAGRHFDLRAGKDAAGNAQLVFEPGVALRIGYGLQPLADLGQSVPAWALSETLDILLEGSAPTLKATPYDATTGTGGNLQVATGALHLDADEPGVTPVSVVAGQCLLYTPPSVSNAHPFQGYSAGTCP